MKALGGSFHLASSPGHGTIATLTLPLQGSAETKVLSAEMPGQERRLKVSTAASPAQNLALWAQHPALERHAKIGVLLVDDHAMVRQGLRAILEAYEAIKVVGEACDGFEALKAVDELRPHVVLMDINMPKMNGVEATAEIKRQYADTIVIGLSVNADADNQTAMMNAGACMLLTKEAAVEHLYSAIQEAVKPLQSIASSHS
jgi:CheY-like chemotaxis protein